MPHSQSSSSSSGTSSSCSNSSDSDEENVAKVNVIKLSKEEGCSTPRKILMSSNSSNVSAFSNNNNDNQNQGESESKSESDDTTEADILLGEDTIDRVNQNQPVFSKDLNQSLSGRKLGGRKVTAPPPPGKLSTFREITDLTKLNVITLENVLECLRERYRCHQYYTYAGPILLSLNSCLRLPRASLIEDVTRMCRYFVNTCEQKENDDDWKANDSSEEQRAPHVYDIGRRCLKNLTNVGSHQIILISGETGAGKTTATQQLIKYLTENNSRNFGANVCSNLDKKIYFATVILESFGNAKTQANPNSSRFGRLVQLNYSKQTGKITGAEIQTYLLEKHRVAKYDPLCETSFHIFYYILHCLRNGTIEMPNNLTWKSIKSVCPEHMAVTSAECESDEVQRLQNAVVAFNMDDFSEVVNILFAMVSLLNMVFVPDCDSSSEEEHFSSSLESPYKTEFTVADWGCARLASELLCIKDTELVDILIARKITAGSSHRHSIFRKPCERASECEERLHALTSFVYDRIFAYVLDHLNTNLKGDLGQDANDLCTMSLLDLYGFENFNVNHLEQICINYANERLQQINISIVKSYYEQSIPPDEVMIPPTELIRIENELYCRIEELHLHVFAFLDEECLLKRLSEDRDILERMRMNLTSKKSKYIQTGKPHEVKHRFTVTHYATPVEYQLKGLVQKNKDHIPPEFQDILKSSDNPFIQNLFKYDLIRSRNASGQQSQTPKSVFTVANNKNTRGKTILTRFKSSVDELMSRLKASENKDVHFIRCIRPNHDLLAGNFSMSIVEKQLHTCGIADVVKIAGNGFPIRIHFVKFANEFPKITSYFCNGNPEPRLLSLVFSGSVASNSIKFGKTMVFMSEKCLKTLKKTERFLTLHHVKIIQRAWKNHLEQKEALKLSKLKESMPHSMSFNLNASHVQDHDPQVHNLENSLNNSNPDVQSESESSQHSSFTITSGGEFSTSSTSLIMNRSGGVCGSFLSQMDVSSSSISSFVAQVQLKPNRPPLFYGNGIASRAPVHTLPIKFYTKKTCLPFAEKPPRRLLPNGIQDAFQEYEMILFKT